jgi:leucyl-tRNA synthetase
VPLLRNVQKNVALLLHPFAPYLAHELWEMIGERESLLRYPWPKYDPALAKEDEVEIVVQVNGKIRARLTVAIDADEESVKQAALKEVQSATEGKQIVKVIVVMGKLVNVVVR